MSRVNFDKIFVVLEYSSPLEWIKTCEVTFTNGLIFWYFTKYRFNTLHRRRRWSSIKQQRFSYAKCISFPTLSITLCQQYLVEVNQAIFARSFLTLNLNFSFELVIQVKVYSPPPSLAEMLMWEQCCVMNIFPIVPISDHLLLSYRPELAPTVVCQE